MRMMTSALCALFMVFTFSAQAAQSSGTAAIPDSKVQQIDELLEVTGALKMGEMMSQAFMQQMAAGLRQAKPDVDPRAFGIVEQEVNQVIHEAMVKEKGLNKMIYPIYNRYFSSAELAELIRFYKTPVGRKTVSVMPTVMQEAMAAGQQWGMSLAPRIQQRVEARLKMEGIALD